MKKETRERLERQFFALPLHHIDTNILIESFKETKLSGTCSDYLDKLGDKYRGEISLPVLGEFFLIIIRDLDSLEEKELLLSKFDSLLKKRRITFLTPIKNTFEIATKIIESDARIQPTDALNYASAVQENATNFVTLDSNLLNSNLMREFGVKITHPKYLI